MKVLITGAKGMLGQDLVDVFKNAGHQVLAAGREDLDIIDQNSVFEFARKEKPDVIINAAAYNFVDKIEEPEFYNLAMKINCEGPGNLAQAAKDIGSKFVHYSTDYVFDGEKKDGYIESDMPNPISKYGETKLAGEKAVQEAGGYWYVCRLAKIFGMPGKGKNSKESFVALMLRLAKELPRLKIVDEEVSTPTYTLDIAKATLQMIGRDQDPGIYHIVNEGAGVTWYEFAKEIFEIANINPVFSPVSSSEFPTDAERPQFSSLKNTKLEKLRDRKQALENFLKRINGF